MAAVAMPLVPVIMASAMLVVMLISCWDVEAESLES
jgi:hypothetical protein